MTLYKTTTHKSYKMAYVHIEGYSDNFSIDDVPWILENIEEFLIPIIAEREKFPFGTISTPICQWHKYIDETYLTFTLSINLDDIKDYHIMISEGGWSETNNGIIYTDCFVDVKVDIESIQQAICDIYLERIPLWNNVHTINYDEFPYVKP